MHPQSDGMVEHLNRTFGGYVIQICPSNSAELESATTSFAHGFLDRTGCTPNELMFGQDVRLPVDLMFSCPLVQVTPPDSTEFAWNLREQVSKVHQLAQDNRNIAS